MQYAGPNNALFRLSYSQTSDQVRRSSEYRSGEESDLSFVWPLSVRWSLMGRWNRGWDSGETLESLLGVEYNACCWKLRLVHHRRLDEAFDLERRSRNGVYLEFQLKGLGSLGRRLDSLLMDGIPGYGPR